MGMINDVCITVPVDNKDRQGLICEDGMKVRERLEIGDEVQPNLHHISTLCLCLIHATHNALYLYRLLLLLTSCCSEWSTNHNRAAIPHLVTSTTHVTQKEDRKHPPQTLSVIIIEEKVREQGV